MPQVFQTCRLEEVQMRHARGPVVNYIVKLLSAVDFAGGTAPHGGVSASKARNLR